MYAVYRTTNTIILYLILSTISIFIPVSGGVGRGQVHCFAQGGGGGGYNAVKTTLNQGRSKAYMKCSHPVISREWSMEC